MKLSIALLVLLTAVGAQALTVEQSEAIKQAVARAKPAELPFVVYNLVHQAKPADKEQIRALAIKTVKEKRPAALKSVTSSIAENRPTETPGNEHGNRPTVPPGPHNYGKP